MHETIPVTRSSMPSFEAYCEVIKPLWESRWLTNSGVLHNSLEEKLCDFLSAPGIALFTNGHTALECALEAFDLSGEVITTPFTFISTTNAIVRKGLTPVFCDINSGDFTLNASLIESCITERTSAILPVHVYGNVCDVEAIQSLADAYNLKVIYDAAHAFGEKRNGLDVTNYGDASMLSFHATKVFNTIEGGAIISPDKSFLERLNQWKNFGITGVDAASYIGGNAKMNEFAAAMGLCNLVHVEGEIEKRHIVSQRYDELLKDVEGVQLNAQQAGVDRNYAYYPIVIHEDVFGHTRDDLFVHLKTKGIIARKYFYPLTSSYSCYNAFDSGSTPIASSVAQRVLTLPLYADLEISRVDMICEVIDNYFRNGV